MKDYNVGLVLEGGGLRGVFTAGVLDYFMEEDFIAPYCIGVSAGACQAFSYLSGQKGRSFKVSADYAGDSRYLSFRNLIRKGEIFGMDFMFDEIPNKLIPFDFENYKNTPSRMVIGAVNCENGKTDYFDNKSGYDMFTICRASSSIPLLSKIVKIDGKPYLDGGVSDPIPIKKAQEDGFEKNIVILTRNKDYRKKESKNTVRIMKRVYRKHPEFVKAYDNRWKIYNETLEYLEKEEKQGKVYIIRPEKAVTVGRLEKDRGKLEEFYQEGFNEGKKHWSRIVEWLGV